MAQELASLLGSGIRGYGKIDVVRLAERDLPVIAVNTRARSKDKFLDAALDRRLKNNHRAVYVHILIADRILNRRSDARLGGKMHYYVNIAGAQDPLHTPGVAYISFYKLEAAGRKETSEICPFDLRSSQDLPDRRIAEFLEKELAHILTRNGRDA